MSDDHPALSHIEKTLADAYRKEIDQEENIWRSLPFFAATLALELAALFQLLNRLPPSGTRAALIAAVLLGLAGLFMFGTLCLLIACIAPRRFSYISREPLLLKFTEDLIAFERTAGPPLDDGSRDALSLLKQELARQFAAATDHNRRINKRREFLRALAGIGTIFSVLMTLMLVGFAFGYYMMTLP